MSDSRHPISRLGQSGSTLPASSRAQGASLLASGSRLLAAPRSVGYAVAERQATTTSATLRPVPVPVPVPAAVPAAVPLASVRESSAPGADGSGSAVEGYRDYGKPLLVGLDNVGNTCFMASVLQCLSNIYGFKRSVRGGAGAGRLTEALEDLLVRLHSGSSGSTNPAAFKREVARFAPRFSGYQQQDAQEFLRFLLDGLHEELNVNKGVKLPAIDDSNDVNLSDAFKANRAWEHYEGRNFSPITALFAGQLVSRVTCAACGYASTTFDPFMDLSLPIPRGSGCTLMDCLDEFMARETLDDLYRCDKCHKRTRATKQLGIYRLPRVLVLQLKRFSSSLSSYSRAKITTDVSFPIDGLDVTALNEGGQGPGVYDLVAVSCHTGSLGGGHYTAYCRAGPGMQWYDYNDSRVSPVSQSSVRGGSAYLLFYLRRR